MDLPTDMDLLCSPPNGMGLSFLRFNPAEVPIGSAKRHKAVLFVCSELA